MLKLFAVILFTCKTMYNKTIIRFGFCDIRNNQGLGNCCQPQPPGSADNSYLAPRIAGASRHSRLETEPTYLLATFFISFSSPVGHLGDPVQPHRASVVSIAVQGKEHEELLLVQAVVEGRVRQ